MTHHPTDETIQDYVDDCMPPDERRKLESHLTACPTCAGTVSELRALRVALRSLPRSAAPPEWSEKVLQEPLRPGARPVPPARSARRFLARAAALGTVFLAGLGIGWLLESDAALPQAPPAVPTTTSTDAMNLAAEVQRTGTAYASAVVALAGVAGGADAAPALAQGREATLSGLYAAALAFRSVAESGDEAARILEAVEFARREVADNRAAPPVGAYPE